MISGYSLFVAARTVSSGSLSLDPETTNGKIQKSKIINPKTRQLEPKSEKVCLQCRDSSFMLLRLELVPARFSAIGSLFE
jgi:hypothetical protein